MTFLAEQGIEKPEWKKDRDKNEGRHNFQIDLGISLLNYGIGLDWDGVSGERPSYMQSGAFKPCDCKKCFFCLKGHTHRITHRPQKPNNCGTQVRTNECTNECVNLGKSSGTFYQMCYRKQLTTELIANKRKRHAEHQDWGVSSARSQSAQSTGKRGMINMHKILLKKPRV